MVSETETSATNYIQVSTVPEVTYGYQISNCKRVRHTLLTLNTNKACGPDGISVVFVVNVHLGSVLFELFQLCYDSGRSMMEEEFTSSTRFQEAGV